MDKEIYEFKAIGRINSWYKSLNGTPRQSSIVPESKGIIELNKTFFDKPYLSLIDLDQYSHIWILFYFHENTNKKVRSKIKPPRLNGQSTGLFATRSPHRPNPIGLSLVKLNKIELNTIHVSGIDILDNTPVLDIKPFIFEYDHPKFIGINDADDKINNEENQDEKKNDENDKISSKDFISSKPEWLNSKGVVYKSNMKTNVEIVNLDHKINDKEPKDRSQFEVLFTERSKKQLNLFHSKESEEHNEGFLIQDIKNEKNLYLSYRVEKLNELNKLKIDKISLEDQNDKDQDDKDQNDKDQNDKDQNDKDEISGNQNEQIEKEENDKSISLIKCKYCLEFLSSPNEAKNAIENLLIHDPRSTYRRIKCSDRLYYFTLDTMHITTYFDEDDKIVEIVKIKPNYL